MFHRLQRWTRIHYILPQLVVSVLPVTMQQIVSIRSRNGPIQMIFVFVGILQLSMILILLISKLMPFSSIENSKFLL